MNATHDPQRKSWVASANEPGCDFPIQNLPFGAFVRGPEPRLGVAIGNQILDLHACCESGLLRSLPAATQEACSETCLNALLSLGSGNWSGLRTRLSELLSHGAHEAAVSSLLVPIAEVSMVRPALIGNYTDFYASIDHATNIGKLLRPQNPLLPNYKYVPIGYHGRASSLVVSGEPVRRPRGQIVGAAGGAPEYLPSRQLDYELEVGFVVGPGNCLGTTIGVGEAAEHLFGVCLLNDWSARDIQAWEYQPLGPFLGKSFASTLSPWVVTMEALLPFRTGLYARPAGDPAPLAYLDTRLGGIDVRLEVYLRAAGAREAVRVSQSNLKDLYWTPEQLLTHHASNGCNLQPGDLLGSGTVSGPGKHAGGCLMELTQRGLEPLVLPGGEERSFLLDGDEVIFRGYCERPGRVPIGFGECSGVVAPAGGHSSEA
jgi:fumarylacetoacetase